MRNYRLGGALLALLLSAGALAGQVTPGPNGWVFREDFRYLGNHAASIAGGSATTVWWDEASWDARGDTNYVSVMEQSATINNRFHLDIHKSLSNDPRDGRLSNTVNAMGGDGSAGVGVMHLDFQDILSARLRNPLLISAQQPGVVSFYAPLFNTTGHWWEIAITPATDIVGAESTAVPGQDDAGLPNGFGTGRQPGPGHSSAADSINLVSFGATDVPCTAGWRVRMGVTKSLSTVRTEYINPVASLTEYPLSAPEQSDTLVLWRLEFRPNGMALYADFDGDGQVALFESWALTIPWSEAHVHMMAVAYQADHHPQEPCYLGHIREMKWRDIEVYPVKYAATDVFPKNANTNHVPTTLGWRGYDLRDIQRFGAAVNGAPQPNSVGYGVANDGRYCNDAGYPCFDNAANAQVSATVPTRAEMNIVDARFVYDTKDSQSTTAGASLSVNGTSIGRLPGHDSVPGSEWQAWVRRSVPFPAALLTPGAAATATASISLDSGMYLDRLEIEIGYQANGDTIFVDGFEASEAPPEFAKAVPPMPYVPAGRGNWTLDETFGGARWLDGRWQMGAHCGQHSVDPAITHRSHESK